MLFELLACFFVVGLLIIFSKEVYGRLEQLLSYTGVRLILPMLLLSWVVIAYAHMVLYGLTILWTTVVSFLTFLMHYSPNFPWKFKIYEVILLAFLSVLPMLLIRLSAKPYQRFSPPYWSSIYMCLLLLSMQVLLKGQA